MSVRASACDQGGRETLPRCQETAVSCPLLGVWLLSLGSKVQSKLGPLCQDSRWDLSNRVGSSAKQLWLGRVEAAEAALGSHWSCLWNLRTMSRGGSQPEGCVCSCSVYTAAGNLMLAQLWAGVPSLQLWQVLASTKWMKLLCGGLGGVLLSCSFCPPTGAEGGKGNINY